MEVHLTPEMEKKLNDLAAQTGRAADELVEDAMTGYLDELTGVRGMLGSRYDDLKSGRIKPIDGDEALARLREKSREPFQESLRQSGKRLFCIGGAGVSPAAATSGRRAVTNPPGRKS